MVHATQEITLGEGEALAVGYVLCFSAPTCQLMGLRKTEQGRDVRLLASLSRDQLASLITALQAVHDQMPPDGP
jgi:hypothetical protein